MEKEYICVVFIPQILYEISVDLTSAVIGGTSGVHCLILWLKIFRLSEFFISFGNFPHRTDPIILIVSKSNLFVLIFLLVTVTPDLKL